MNHEDHFDAIIVGAGFSGLYSLHKLRSLNFKVRLYEAGSYLGGTWHLNTYPGARCDSDNQTYQFSKFDLWKGFQWQERFPGYPEIQNYFKYVDETLNLSKDIQYNTRVTGAAFDDKTHQWRVTSDTGVTAWAKYLILCTGFASKRYIPPLKGLENFKGEAHHTSEWPQGGLDLKGKRIAVIGTGASGVQVIQEVGPGAAHLTVFQRTLNMALPMVQYKTAEDNPKWHLPGMTQEDIFKFLLTTNDSLPLKYAPRNAMDDSPEERKAFYEGLYKQGGLAFWLATYQDTLYDLKANAPAYKFWCEKTRARITDPKKRNILAPLKAPHPFGTKQPCLEQCYYEIFNQDNVEIIDVNKSPIVEVTADSIVTQNEGPIEVDVIIFATGYDAVTGGILAIDIKNGQGETLQEKWLKNGISTYLGMTTVGFPNLLFLYGPQSPGGFVNGPTHAEIQGDWLADLLVKMRSENISTVKPTKAAEVEWVNKVEEIWAASLFPGTESWYQGSNIPGKPKQTLLYAAGMPNYIQELEKVAMNNYDGFVFE